MKSFLLYLGVVLAIGTATNIEGFAKSVFTQELLNKFNKINTCWLILYFFLLQFLQFSLPGVFFCYLVFYSLRCVVAAVLAGSVDSIFSWKQTFRPLIPSISEAVSYAAGFIVSSFVMTHFKSNESIGFIATAAIAVIHMGVFAFSKRKTLVAFKTILRD